MSFRTRIYRSVKVGKGRRVVTSGKYSDWLTYDIIAWLIKAFFYIGFFWIIIPIKIIKNKRK